MLRDGQRSTLGPGETADIAPGVWHDWWNEGEVDAVVRVEITPGERFVHMIETLFGLAREGHVNAKGMPSPLQLALIGREFSDVIVFRRPPPAHPAGPLRRTRADRAGPRLSGHVPEPLADHARAPAVGESKRPGGARELLRAIRLLQKGSGRTGNGRGDPGLATSCEFA